MQQVCIAADELDTVIITGHTGFYDGIDTLLGVCTAYGFLRRKDLITPAGARPGDLILCTKPIGLEVLTNLAIRNKNLATRLFGASKTRDLARCIRMQSCVQEARLLAESGTTTAMHDATEGGLVVALNELASASNVGFVLDYQKLPVLPELQRLAEHFDLSRNQLLSISSTGTLLAAISPTHTERILRMLATSGISPRIIGSFTRSDKRIIRYKDRETSFPKNFDDSYAKILS
jgi:hydrogenase maturation factor